MHTIDLFMISARARSAAIDVDGISAGANCLYFAHTEFDTEPRCLDGPDAK